MNAITNNVALALAAAHAHFAPAVAEQPLVPADLQLLKVAYPHGELLLDLHGTLDQHGYVVTAVSISGAAAPGRPVDVAGLLSPRELADMGAWADRFLPSARQLQLVSQAEHRAERLMWERMRI